VQSDSRPFRVEGGRSYELAAHVRVLSETTGYKVTVDWLGADGRHFEYANDWQGNDRPTEWSLHATRVAAPAGARSARIILGVRPGVAALMDAISFELR